MTLPPFRPLISADGLNGLSQPLFCLRRDKFVGLFPGFLYMHRNPVSLANRLFGAKITGNGPEDGMGCVAVVS